MSDRHDAAAPIHAPSSSVGDLSVDAWFRETAARQRPAFLFDGTDHGGWTRWREALLPRVVATLGPMPVRPTPTVHVVAEWVAGDLRWQQLRFAVEDGLAASAYLLRRVDLVEPAPAVLACHGHGSGGKEAVVGRTDEPALAAAVRDCNYGYGLALAEAGFVVLAPDWRGFGERDDRSKPHFRDPRPGDDLCDVHAIRATLLGRTLLGMDVHDGLCALDLLAATEGVDPTRLGVIGLSFGGTMATWLALLDERVKAAEVACYSIELADAGIGDVNVCGSQITPGLLALCDVAELQGLIAPRPLLVDIGVHDECFRLEPAMRCHQRVEQIYQAAAASDRLELDLFSGGHAWSGRRSVDFFRQWLG